MSGHGYIGAVAALALSIASVAALAGPPELPPLNAEQAAQVSYRRHVWPILKRHCWGCHTEKKAEGGLNVDRLDSLAAGGEGGATWIAGSPDASLLVRVLTGEVQPSMPLDLPPLSATKIHVIRQWILAGAKDDGVRDAASSAPPIPQVYDRPPPVTALAYSPNGAMLAAACQSEVVLLAPDEAPQGAARRLATLSELIHWVEFSPDGSLLAAAGGTPGAMGEISFFSTADGTLVSRRELAKDTLFRGAFSADGALAAVGGTEGAIWLAPVDPALPARRFDLHSDWVLDVAFAQGGTLLVSAGRDKTIKASLADSGTLLRTLATQGDRVGTIASAGPIAIAAGRDGQPAIYDLLAALPATATDQPEPKPDSFTRKFEPQGGEILDLALDKAGVYAALVTGNGDTRVYRLADLTQVMAAAYGSPAFAVAIRPDGGRLAVGGMSGEIAIFEISSGQLVEKTFPLPVRP